MSSAGLIVVLLGMGINWPVLRRHVLQPIAALDRASRALSAGKLDARVPVPVGVTELPFFDTIGLPAHVAHSGSQAVVLSAPSYLPACHPDLL